MSLFQNSVLNKYLKGLESEKVSQAYDLFKTHFHNPTIQENIRNSKEEQYQGEFLIDFFVNVLGYTKNPTPNFNLTTELKNIKGSKKTDGAILKDKKALAVIELKGTNTTDLSKVETQAFGYKNNQPGSNYVITSNFEKLRFYIDNAVDFEEFNLFQLSKERFDILWLCISSEYLLKDIPKKIKDESLTQEENVTKKLYKDYASFRNEIFDAIQKENPEYDKLTLFKKTQKLLDRFLFIFFAEDRLLLPPNSIRSIVNQWTDLKDKYDEYFPLYDRFKKYFGYMNTGYKGQQHDIFAYNGGLFAPDEILDNIKINDDLLYKHTVNLSNYNFESEVSVNILGHIFEHSLNDIDEIQAEIQGIETEQNKTKRKKDGVFYTPKYITKYIVDNTVGKLCEEKKTELDIQEAEYEKERKGRQKATLKKLTQKLEDYRKWLLQITICDPACGSGAFLNQALEFLIVEHQYIDELQAKLFGDAMILSEVENSILENNLFGVDINEESVEIAKLSLWLRTAQKGRKLTSLNNNIKCGNSLIDDAIVAGDKAFNWQSEFPEVFVKGGFDVVIGNPPYVRKQGLVEHYPEMCKFYEKEYQSATANYDIYALFMERSFDLINTKGVVSYILPHKFLVTDFGEGIRQFFKDKTAVESILHFGSEMVFADASTYTCIINLSKSQKDRVLFKKVNPLELATPFDWDYILLDNLSEQNWDLQSQSVFDVVEKLKQQPYTIDNVFDKIFQGIASGGDKFFTLELIENKGQTGLFYSEMLNENIEIEFGILKPFVKGNQISKYQNIENTLFTLFPYSIVENKGIALGFNQIENEFPLAAIYYRQNEEFLRGREKGRFNNEEEWFLFSRKQGITGVEFPKIMTQEISLGCNMTYDEKGEFYHPTTIYSFVKNGDFEVDEKLYLGILNSKVMWFFLKNTGTELRGGYFRFKTNYLKPFPLPEIPTNPYLIIDNVNLILSQNKDLQSVEDSFIALFQSKFSIEKLSKKLQNWHDLDFGEFLKELEKARKKSAKENDSDYTKLSLPEEAEWMQYFNEQKQKAEDLKTEIDKTDAEIDQMVYELYGLTDVEIAIVEEATK